jgi:DNA-binding beta-propeller fold protein YncE
VLSRRAILAIPFAAACTRGPSGYRGYAFVANEDGSAIAAVDLQALAVVRHIVLDAAPAEVAAAWTRPSIYALTPSNGSIHEIESDRLTFKRKLAAVSTAVSMRLAPSGRALYVLASDPRSLVRISLDSLRVEWKLALPDVPLDFDVTRDEKTGAVSSASGVRFIDLDARKLSTPVCEGDYGAVRFRKDGLSLIAADRGARRLSIYDSGSRQLVTHLPLAVRPDNLCFKPDDGQLFITGEGLDAVVIVYPYHTPEVAKTILAGHGPAAMAATNTYVFVASPQAGNVSILTIDPPRVLAVVSVGSDPGFITITPEEQYVLVLNRKSGDVAVLRAAEISPTPHRPSPLLTMIPVGSRPVSAAVKSV